MGLEFLHFGLLPYFLPLVAIPIVLHLLTLHRLKTVELSTFRFLFDSYVQQRRRMKFLEWLIALLRTLFLLFLVGAISRPIVQHWDALFGRGEAGRDVVMLLDTSASMGAATNGVTSLEFAKRAALEVVDRLGSDDRVTLLRVASQTEEICSRFSSDTESLTDEINALRVTPSRGNLFAAFSSVFNSQTRELNNPLVYVFTDVQQTGWSEFSDGQADGLIPDGTEVIVVEVGSSEGFSNQAIVGGATDNQRAIVGLPVTLRPRVSNFSDEVTQDVSVSVFVDEKEIAVERMTLKPGETGEAEVVFVPSVAGILRGRYQIEADRFVQDDEYLFTLAVAPRLQVLLVNGRLSPEPMQNAATYLRTAMIATETNPEEVAGLEATDAGAAMESENEFARSLDVIDVAEGGLTIDMLSEADVVVLANCGTLNSNHFNWLCDFVAEGGGLLVFPGDRVNQDVYGQQLLNAPTRPDEMLVAATLQAAEGDIQDATGFQQLGAIDFAHPVFSVFDDSDQRYFGKVRVYRHFPVNIAEDSENTWPIAEFTDGKPAIVESRFGNGRVILSAFPLHTSWGNLPLRPEFVPMVLRMISYAKRAAEVEGPSVVAADGSAEFVVNQKWAPVSANVIDSNGRSTQIEFQRSNSRLMAAFDRTTEQGFYTVDISGGRAEQPKHGVLSFAVNLAAEESDFTALTEPQLNKLLPNAAITMVDATADVLQEFGNIGNEREIWRPLIIILFVIIGIEFLLSTLGGHIAGEDEPSTGQRIRDLAQGRWVGRMTGADIEQEIEESVTG
ncbi:MAG: VWA domain-containing protein [Pirellulaceae bacterium]|nr:VWA domain-containing protein [Pirellulaceae bacterium]